MSTLLERPARLLSLFLAIGLGVGGSLAHLASPSQRQVTFEAPPAHMCGHAVSEWMREHGQLDEDSTLERCCSLEQLRFDPFELVE